MKNKIIDFLINKKIAILGFGIEGKSTYTLSEQEKEALQKAMKKS